MSLVIADPPVGESVYKFSNGVIAIRLADFVGPARATLSTVSDPLSICGTVVRDEQQIVYTGTDPNKTINPNTGQDSVRIHSNDLALDDHFIYRLYLSVRATGEVDPTKRNSGHTFLQVGSNAARITGYSRNAAFSTLFGPTGTTGSAPKSSTNPYYKIIDCGGQIFWGVFTEGQVWYVLRACTGVGGDYTWYLDCAWLVPIGPGGARAGDYSNFDFRQLLFNSNFDPLYNLRDFTYDPTKDDVSIDWLGSGQYSVMAAVTQGYVIGDTSIADHQIGDNEKTVYDIKATFTTSDWTVEPPSDLAMVIGSHYIPSHTVDSDSFNRTTPATLGAYLGNSDEGRAWSTFSSPLFPAFDYMRCNGSELEFSGTRYDSIHPSGHRWSFADSVVDPLDDGEMIGVFFGQPTESGTGSTTIGHEIFQNMHHGILEVKVKLDWILAAGCQVGLAWSSGLTAGGAGAIAAILDIPSQGAFGFRATAPMNCYLTFIPIPGADRGTFSLTTLPNQLQLDGPLSLTTAYSPNTWVRIKLEKRWYRFRAKFWFDGDTEPTNWQLEAHQPSSYLNSAPYTIYEYPYNLSPNYGTVARNPLGLQPLLFTRLFRPIEGTDNLGFPFNNGVLRLLNIKWDDFTLDYEAYGDTPKDVHLKIDKYTGSPVYGSLTIPYQAQRMVLAETDSYVFNNDVDGVNVTLWKEEESPETQAAVIGDLWQKKWKGSKIGVYELVSLR